MTLIRASVVGFGLVIAVLMERYYKDLFHKEENPLEWNLLSYGMMIAFLIHLPLILQTYNINFNSLLETLFYLIPSIGAFTLMIGSLKLWREFKLD